MLKGANEIDNIAWVLAKSRILYFIYIRANNTRWRNEMSHLLCCQKNIRTRDSNRKFNKFPLAFTKLAPNLKYQNAVYFAQKKIPHEECQRHEHGCAIGQTGIKKKQINRIKF